MIIIQAAGGLGNQMQQYALYYKLKTLGREVRMDLSWFEQSDTQANVLKKRQLELAWFQDLPIEACTPEEKEQLTGGNGLAGKLRRKLGLASVFEESSMYHPGLLQMKDGYLQGYFACEKYYADVLGELRELFRFPKCVKEGSGRKEVDPVLEDRNAEYRRLFLDPSVHTVSIHLRRGDYLDSANAGLFGGICTPAYYEGAVRYLKQLEDASDAPRSMRFVLFSDDPEYAGSLHFGGPEDENLVVSCNTGENALQDIRLMSCCESNICANSTFSFWGARLNGRKDAVRVRPLVHKNTQKEDPVLMHGLWEGWILADRDGNIV